MTTTVPRTASLQSQLATLLEVDVIEASGRVGELTPREFEYARLLASGITNQAVAEQMGISPKTGDIHRTNIYRKLGVKTAVGAARYIWVAVASRH